MRKHFITLHMTVKQKINNKNKNNKNINTTSFIAKVTWKVVKL